MTTQHHIGQVAKAEVEVAHVLDTAPADADHQRRAKAIVQQLQTLGWTPPRDPTAAPPLRPATVATDAQWQAYRAHIDNEIAAARQRITTVDEESQP